MLQVVSIVTLHPVCCLCKTVHVLHWWYVSALCVYTSLSAVLLEVFADTYDEIVSFFCWK